MDEMSDSRAPGALPILPGDSGPPQGTGSSKAKQWLVSPQQDGQQGVVVQPGVQSLFLFSPVLPAPEGGAVWVVESGEPAAARFPEECVVRCSSPGSRAGGTAAMGATITAPRRGPARPAGPRRGQQWHTTGADHWSCETLSQVSSSHCLAETECSPTRERNHPT